MAGPRVVALWVAGLLVVIGAGVAIESTVSPPEWTPQVQGMLRYVPCLDSGGSSWCVGLGVPLPGVVDRIEVPARVVAGGSIAAVLVVTNETGQTVNLRTQICAPQFGLWLTGDKMPPAVLFNLDCVEGPSLLRPGETRFKFRIPATVTGCSQDPGGRLPLCINGVGMPPLPPGVYVAVLFGYGYPPLPPAVSSPITVLPATK